MTLKEYENYKFQIELGNEYDIDEYKIDKYVFSDIEIIYSLFIKEF